MDTDDWDVNFLPEHSYLPDLSRWKLAAEVNIEQAALLLAGIDPIKDDLNSISRKNHRWEDHAKTHVIAIIGAIRQGLLQPVFCAYRDYYEGDWLVHEMKPSDRTREISIYDTVVTRNALTAWVERSGLEPISYRLYREKLANEKASNRRPHNNNQADLNTQDTEKQTSIYEDHKNDKVKYLPKYTHESEGITYLKMVEKEFWSTWDKDNPNTLPSKEEVVKYLMAMGSTKNMADAVDMILRPIEQRYAHLRNRKLPTRGDQ